MESTLIKSVAVIGAGASGAAAAAALVAENVFDIVRVFERRESPGGTWIYDADPGRNFQLQPGKHPPEVDLPLKVPRKLPRTTSPCSQYRFDRTPIYAELTTNVPATAMAFSDKSYPYGPFVPHWVPKQYIENYFSWHRIDSLLVLNTTVEDISRSPVGDKSHYDRWKLVLRRSDSTRHLDVWWEESFDAIILANGHYSVPFVPAVKGLDDYMRRFPGRVVHSKTFRTTDQFINQRVLVIGNAASGHDITTLLVSSDKPKMPVYQSRRSRSRWDGQEPPHGVKWKPVIREYSSRTSEIIFEDGTRVSDIDVIIYCTGYKPSFPFWNEQANGGPLFDYEENRLINNYQHTFSRTFPYNLGIIGIPRVLTFRSFEYQAVALARLFAGRNAKALPVPSEQAKWEQQRAELVRKQRRKFHDIQWDTGETIEWLRFLFEFSGLPVLEGSGRYPPILGEKTRWALDHVRKYPEPGKESVDQGGDWIIVDHPPTEKDSLHFI